MARFHGDDCRVYLGVRDASADLVSIDLTASAETHDATTFGSSNFREVDAGLFSWEGALAGFWQTNSGAGITSIERQLENILGSDTSGKSPVSVYVGDADAIGDTGYLTSDAVVTKMSTPIAIGDLIKVSATMKGNGRLGFNAILLHVLAADSTSTNSASVDNAASSASGGRGNLHVTAATGSGGTIKIQHSSDNSVWVDLVTYTASTAASCQTSTVTGTVNRYLRAISTISAASSVTFVAGFARF